MATLQPPRCDTELRAPPNRYFTGWKNLKCVIQGSSKASLLLGAQGYRGETCKSAFWRIVGFGHWNLCKDSIQLTYPIQFGSWEDEFIFPLWWDM